MYSSEASGSGASATFSSAGPTVEGFVKPEIVAPGGHVRGLMKKDNWLPKKRKQFHDGDGYYTMSGTSQSAAVVSGVAALVLQADPTLSPDDVKCRLMASARGVRNEDGSPRYSILRQGAGLVDAYGAVNSDVVGKYVNIASRTANFIVKQFDGELLDVDACFDDPQQAQSYMDGVTDAAQTIAGHYEARDYSHALRRIMELADEINQYFDEQEPWKLAKDPTRKTHLHRVCSRILHGFHTLSIFLAPVLPGITARVATELFSMPQGFTWADLDKARFPVRINKFKHLARRIEADKVQAMIDASKQDLTTAAAPTGPLAAEPMAETISFDDFARVDLRIARIAKAEAVPQADKLLRLTLDLGGETRNVFAGIKSAYQPQDLEGKLTVMVANLAPRKMRFGVSEGMVLAAGPGGSDIYILEPQQGAQPGMRVK